MKTLMNHSLKQWKTHDAYLNHYYFLLKWILLKNVHLYMYIQIPATKCIILFIIFIHTFIIILHCFGSITFRLEQNMYNNLGWRDNQGFAKKKPTNHGLSSSLSDNSVCLRVWDFKKGTISCKMPFANVFLTTICISGLSMNSQKKRKVHPLLPLKWVKKN